MSWNLAHRVGDAARRQGEFLGRLVPSATVVLLQEVNRRSIDELCRIAGLDWCKPAVDVRPARAGEPSVRWGGVALAGRACSLSGAAVVPTVPFPERTIYGAVKFAGLEVMAASYHAPPGVSWGLKKPEQAARFAEWLSEVRGPVILGADANTPKVDALCFDDVRTHWHTGARRLRGEPGEDTLWGPAKVHDLEDAFRRWLGHNPAVLEHIRAQRPHGPLAVSHLTGKRSQHPGTPRRFDSVWLSHHFSVIGVDHPYDQSVFAGSDHSAVVVDLEVRLPDRASSNHRVPR